MKIGGKFYLAQAQHHKRLSYSRQLNRRAVRAHEAAVQFYGQALFAANIRQGEESVRLTIKRIAERLSGDMQARFAAYDQLKSSVSELGSRSRSGLDLTV